MKTVAIADPSHSKILSDVIQYAAGPESAMSIGEMRLAMKVLDKIEGCQDGDDLQLENEEYEYLKTRFAAARFTKVQKVIIDVADAIEGAK